MLTAILFLLTRRDATANSKGGNCNVLIATFRQMRNPYQILIIPLTMWIGFGIAFILADFSAVILYLLNQYNYLLVYLIELTITGFYSLLLGCGADWLRHGLSWRDHRSQFHVMGIFGQNYWSFTHFPNWSCNTLFADSNYALLLESRPSAST